MWTAKNSKIILKNSFLFYKKQAVLSVSSVIQSPETSSFLPHQAILRIATQFQKLSCLSADCNKWTEKWRGSHHQASHWNPNTQLLWNYHVLLPMQSSVYVICVVMWPLSMCINDTNLDMQWHEHSYTAHVFLWAWMARHTAHVFLWAWMACPLTIQGLTPTALHMHKLHIHYLCIDEFMWKERWGRSINWPDWGSTRVAGKGQSLGNSLRNSYPWVRKVQQ